MATSSKQTLPQQQSDTPVEDKPWYADPAYQNAAIALITQYQNNRNRDGAQAVTQGNVDLLAGMKPTGMDFSRFQPLMSALGDTSFTRGNAIKDSQGFIDEIFRQYETQSLPKIYSNPRSSGIYNDTSTQLLANDAYSGAVAKGQANLFQNILAYSQARQNQLGPVLGLLNAQVSNSNALMGANTAYNSALVGATGANAAVGAQNAAGNRTDNLTAVANLINAGTTAYNQYQESQKDPYGDGSVQQDDYVTTSDGEVFWTGSSY
jgi:hypothetical protein